MPLQPSFSLKSMDSVKDVFLWFLRLRRPWTFLPLTTTPVNSTFQKVFCVEICHKQTIFRTMGMQVTWKMDSCRIFKIGVLRIGFRNICWIIQITRIIMMMIVYRSEVAAAGVVEAATLSKVYKNKNTTKTQFKNFKCKPWLITNVAKVCNPIIILKVHWVIKTTKTLN